MNLKRFIPLLSALILTVHQSFGAYSFKEESVLAGGKWVKIEIGETGLYSIPHTLLRDMGFQEPEKVGVYGKGGMMMNLQFSASAVSSAGHPYSDDLSQISSLHSNEALIFWGCGIENVSLQPGTTASGPYFENYRQNIYSKVAYYFLSDVAEHRGPETATTTGSSFSSLKNGWGFVRYEKDLEQNSTKTGNLFWGESFKTDGAVKEWTVPVNNMTAGTSHLSYQVYSLPGDKFTLRTKCSAAKKEKVFPVDNSDVNYFFPLRGRLAADPYKYATPDTLRFQATPQKSVVISIAAEDIKADYVNLDYWLLTYPKQILANPLSDNLSADLYYFKGNKNTNYKLPLAEGLCAWDLSDPQSARTLSPLKNDASSVGFRLASNTTIPVVIFDPTKPQKAISGWSPVKNNNIHGLQNEGIELLIIAVPKLKAQAEELAELHRKHDNIKVLVATPEEIYNEFSGGVPDPMAYRAAAKMLYGSGLKNLLLFGPSMRNMLLEVTGETPFDRHIALQHSYVKPEEEAVPAYEFYGVMTDDPSEANLHTERKEIGVGLLSCETPEDCDRIIRKIARYLTSDDQAWIVNETMTIGGLGDNHLHDEQAVDSGEHIKKLAGNGGMAHNDLIIDAYGKAEARTQLKSLLDRGKIWNIYFGHGGPWMIGQDARFFTTGDLQSLKNRYPGIVFMGGCDFSLPDIRVRGLGESFVLDCDHGMIAAIVSTRTAWSSQNKYLGDVLTECWLNPADKSTSPTIGEIFAKAKSKSNALNHLSFVLAGDPAIKVPAPYQGVDISTSASAAAGEKIRISGKICSAGDEPDPSFNGKIVLKLMEPEVTLRSRDYATDTCSKLVEGDNGPYHPVIDVPYESTLIAAVEGDVTDGSFDIEMVLPSSVSEFAGETLKIKAGAFDKTRWLGGAGATSLVVSDKPAAGNNPDNLPPAINFEYDNSRQLIALSILDDSAVSLDPGAFTASVDGKPVSISSVELAAPGENGSIFNGYYDAAGLADGKHTIVLTASDVAGNITDGTFTFEKVPVAAPLSLILESKAGVEKISATVDGTYSGSLNVEITDAKGMVNHTFTTTGNDFEWDLCGADGRRVPEGYYRICVRSGEPKHPKYSEWVEFAVLSAVSQ